ncbi:E3 ubiquitin-protein ligase RNF170-like isoform X1 [Argiope bruennichi]|uniref:E3 ubiquitin-protein ligase RNF170-like isoform X1 n=2 Tax=Argiope bruennichi TaxID=94029 RepID=UPI002494681D|nr:E3 ubiquitin-protein ligase RNF170-like isoform X1 [Argiope bruennichi]
MNSNENYIVEGIGNEVLVSVTGFVCIIVGSYFLYQRLMHTRLFDARPDQPSSSAQQLSLVSDRFNGNADPNMQRSTRAHYGSDHQCPVCLNEPHYPVETNCGHLFCAQCVITYWRHGNWMGAIHCPVCRQLVTALLQCFTNSSDLSSTERVRLLEEINDYNRHYSGEPRPWLDYLWDLPTLLRHAGSEFFSVGGIMYMFRLRIFLCFIAAVMYLISPLDMIPEAVFGILGLLDDMFVVLLLAIYVTVIYRRFLAARWQNQ